MKCPFCLTENKEETRRCTNCDAVLLHRKKLSRGYIDSLLEKGCIESRDELMQIKTIQVFCRCDDGMGLPPGLEVEIEVPLYYNEGEIIALIQQKGVRPDMNAAFFRIDEFHDDPGKGADPEGSMVLAEAIADNLQKLMLHVVVNTHRFMLSQAVPDKH